MKDFRARLADPDAALGEADEADAVEYLADVERLDGKAALVKAADELLRRLQSDRVLLMSVQASSSLGDIAGAVGRLAKFGSANSTLPGLLRAEHFLQLSESAGASPDLSDTVAMYAPPSRPETTPRAGHALEPASPSPTQHLVPAELGARTDHPVSGQLVGGHYQIDGFVAEGRLGQVFRATRSGTPRHVALKVLLPVFARDEVVAQRFLRTAEQAQALDHPAVVRVFGSGVDRGWVFAASEMVFGGNLNSFVDQRGSLPPQDAVRVVIDITRAVAYAFDRGVVHGGLRPANVLMSLDEEDEVAHVRVADFGMADIDRAMVTFDSSTAPERLAGAVGSPAGDVYGIGTLLYQLLTGTHLFKGVSLERLKHLITHEQAPQPQGVPAQLVQVLDRCLRKDPAGRYESARELLPELEAITHWHTAEPSQVGDATQTTLRALSAASPARPLIGKELNGRFRVVSFMCSGGMAQLYAGTQAEEPRRVAIKAIHPHLASEPEIVKRFAREARLAAKLDHPNIVRVIHVGEDSHLLYIAMELLRGEDLSTRLKLRGRVAESSAAEMGIAIAKGLAYAHAAGVVHRDIKPGNVMCCLTDAGEQIKLLDFGIAKSLDRFAGPQRDGRSVNRTAITMAGDLVGTPRYMSPEQARAGEVDHRADLYSLGVLLYELVTGVVPFEGETPLQIISRHVRDQPRPPSAWSPELHPGLERVILELLRKSPNSRPSSASDVAQSLSALVPQLSASPATSAHRWMDPSKSSGPRTVIPTTSFSPITNAPPSPDVDPPTHVHQVQPERRQATSPVLVPERPLMASTSPHAGEDFAGVTARSVLALPKADAVAQPRTTPLRTLQSPLDASTSPTGRTNPDELAAQALKTLPITTSRMDRQEVLREARQFMVPPVVPAAPDDTETSTVPDAQRATRTLARAVEVAREEERRAMREQIARLYRIVWVLLAIALVALVAFGLLLLLR